MQTSFASKFYSNSISNEREEEKNDSFHCKSNFNVNILENNNLKKGMR